VGDVDHREVAVVKLDPSCQRLSLGDGGKRVHQDRIVLAVDQRRSHRVPGHRRPERPGPIPHHRLLRRVENVEAQRGCHVDQFLSVNAPADSGPGWWPSQNLQTLSAVLELSAFWSPSRKVIARRGQPSRPECRAARSAVKATVPPSRRAPLRPVQGPSGPPDDVPAAPVPDRQDRWSCGSPRTRPRPVRSCGWPGAMDDSSLGYARNKANFTPTGPPRGGSRS
jgi:hypothetical protein